MRLTDLQEQTVDEAPMNPTAFGQAIAAGQEAGVLVGYEFEVCIPEETVNSGAEPEKESSNRTPNDIVDILRDFDVFEDLDFDAISLADFDKTFKLKRPINGSNNMQQAYENYVKMLLPTAKERFNEIPEEARKKYLKMYKERYGMPTGKDIQSQLEFASRFGRLIYADARGGSKLEELGIRLRYTANQARNWGSLFEHVFGLDTQEMAEQFNRLFKYDNADTAYNALRLDNFDEDDYNDDYDKDPEYSKAANVLASAIQSTMGVKVNIFNEYHESRKNMTDWYIEPDGSLEPDEEEDTTAEIVTPPLPAAKAIEDLQKFYAMASQLKLYTNNTTGLHINVSIPAKLDVLKLAMFLGDQHVLKYFNRLDNRYADSVTKSMNQNVQGNEYIKTKTSTKLGAINQPSQTNTLDMKALQSLVQDFSGQHTASISNNGKYISFRHAGGNYLADYNGIYNTVGRFIRAMIIASDPNAYANEYKTKLAKMVNQDKRVAADTPANKLVQHIRANGVPILTVHLANFSRSKPEDLIARQFGQAYVVDSLTADPNAKQELLKANQTRGYIKNQLEGLDPSKFFTVILSPSPSRFVRFLQYLPSPGIHTIENRNWNTVGYYSSVKGNLPATDPRIQMYIKELLKMYYKK